MQSVNIIESYHAHVYFSGDDQRRAAAALREEIGRRFPVWVGTLWDKPIGPHPLPMFEIAFETHRFAEIIPWLMLNRTGLAVLVHPNTGRPRRDHLNDSLWLGEVLELIVDPYLT
ncbi:MAG TPA: DOPA 4,5-dioxygenase family protein [Candidatus Tumulicola sp.]